MHTKNFLLAAFVTAVLLFILNALVFGTFLGNFFQTHPAVSPEFMKQLYRPNDELIWWAVLVSASSNRFPRCDGDKVVGRKNLSIRIKNGIYFWIFAVVYCRLRVAGKHKQFHDRGCTCRSCM